MKSEDQTSPLVRRSPGELTWRDLKRGDRVSHFEYGTGTIHASGPMHIIVDWDSVQTSRHDHTLPKEVARFMTRVEAAGD